MQSEILKEKRLSSRAIGLFYEKIACSYLIKNGFTILGKNIYTRFGEIDILAKKDGIFYIFEIKGGKSREANFERFSRTKIERLGKLAEIFRIKYNLKFILVDGLVIVAMEGNITVIHVKNILQQGC